jgi:tRNA 2-thiouridine synthesizing protein E
MTTPLQVHGRDIPRDKDGYLKQLADWDRDVAAALALDAGITLNAEHWAVIDVLRGFYEEHHLSPATRVLVKAVGRALGAEKGSSAYLMQLFPATQSPALIIARIAGLPRPTNCL